MFFIMSSEILMGFAIETVKVFFLFPLFSKEGS